MCNFKRAIIGLTVFALFFVLSAYAVPLMINYQGKIDVGGTMFDGQGLFKFAIVDSTGTIQYWSNDGNDPPTSLTPIEVNHGLFTVMLGDTALMDTIPASVFEHDDIYLRVWFNDVQGGGTQLLSPDNKIASVGFAIKAQEAVNAETVGGIYAADLEESAEIDTKIATHTSISSAHHAKTTQFSELTDTATDGQIPDDITVNHAATSGDADRVDGYDYNADWPTTLLNIQTATTGDFHNIGGIDDDQPDGDAEVPDVISINNGSLYAMSGRGNVGIGTSSPGEKLEVAGNFKATGNITAEGIPEYSHNQEALSAGLTAGSFFRTGDFLKIVHEPANGDLFSSDAIVGNMRVVLHGEFVQGSPEDEDCQGSDETQFAHVLTRDIAVMETEVSRQMWADLRGVEPTLPADPSDIIYSPTTAHPVQQNTWYESVLFANLLSIQNGFARCYYTDIGFSIPIDASNYTTGPFYCDFDAAGYRLPTEGEWEYFCRAGTTGPFSCEEVNYTGTNCGSCTSGTHPNLEQYAVYCANDPGATALVGSKLTNPWNLFNMHGNVNEWCWDWFDPYPGSSTDYTGPSTGSNRVRRGGTWVHTASSCRSAARHDSVPFGISIVLGFRLVRSIE